MATKSPLLNPWAALVVAVAVVVGALAVAVTILPIPLAELYGAVALPTAKVKVFASIVVIVKLLLMMTVAPVAAVIVALMSTLWLLLNPWLGTVAVITVPVVATMALEMSLGGGFEEKFVPLLM